MAEYFVSVTVISAFLGLLSYLSYPTVSDKTVKFASSVLLLYTVAMPIGAFVSDLSDGSVKIEIDEIIDGLGETVIEDAEYKKVAEEAFREGIEKLIRDKYGVGSNMMDVYIYGYDFENMSAERITVIMKGTAVLKDFRLIEDYLNGLNLGKCEVKSQIG